MPNEIEHDPIAENAARYALEVTQKPRKVHPWFSRVAIIVIALFLLVGTSGAVFGVINTYRENTTTSELSRQSDCQKNLLKNLTEEQQARTRIQADDRNAQKAFNKALSNSNSLTEARKAYAKFQQESAKNEQRRKNFPVPQFNEDVCNFHKGAVKIVPSDSSTSSNSPTATPRVKTTTLPNGSKTTVTTTPQKQKTSQSNSNGSNNPVRSSRAPEGKRTTARSKAPTRTTPSSPRSSENPGILPILKCSTQILGAKLC